MNFAILVLAGLASAAILEQRDACGKGNNCARAVTGTREPPSQESKSADCSSYQTTTVTPYVTRTYYETVTKPREERDAAKRAPITGQNAEKRDTPHTIPAYASACTREGEYASACSCFGVPPTTTEASIETVWETVTVFAALSHPCCRTIMWLINARTLRLVYIEDEAKTPRYAILSHTWGNGEITFREMMALNSRLARKPKKKPGWSKVVNTCRLALSYKCDYAWIDTCCIDTSSSAELQEAINSMFHWYERAEICFVHLEDVAADEDYKKPDCSFRKSRWFRRGWTLQEMLAPGTLVFYDTAWSVISDKDDEDLRTIITEITGIDDYYLSPGNRKLFANAQQWLSHASVAERMSWAAGRETTRKEDLAYSLLGIFNINMPMLYGEGMKAFQRLQEEIMKIDDDSSLLCWGFDRPSYQTSEYDDESSILATHPDTFKHCRNIKPMRNRP
ncbi:heterokaryon incompatibility protein-domain-containing protein [Stachybotrys elegans]|uniref:Heterokaryon incompatibility protein-domain-containing protein n=1 Tax=Stachybotrys elegans TaxID=80388 RepID=A0A8K0SLD9_9HYPO|nr:heterokaryon incompatibility protein-domain-containing protein [Stachybotrys elegans]